DVGASSWVHAHASDDGHVEGAVQTAVTAAVDAVPHGVARGRGDWAGAGEAGERSLGSDPTQLRPGRQRDGGGDRADAGLVEQATSGALANKVCDALGDVLELLVERSDPFGEPGGLAARGRCGEGFIAGPPCGSCVDLGLGERAASVDA